MKLHSRRMQIKQNFRDEKSERFGFGLRASYSRSAGRILVLSLLATLSTIVLWLIGYHAENKGKRTARTVLTGMCYSVSSATRQGSSSLTRLTGQSAMTSST